MNADNIPAAVRAYIEAEWRGATPTALRGMQAEVCYALLLADSQLSADAANFRFHNLVAEMRDNDSVTPASKLAPSISGSYLGTGALDAAIAADEFTPQCPDRAAGFACAHNTVCPA